MTERLSLSLSLWFLENFFPYVKESTENNKILYINYPSVKKKKKKNPPAGTGDAGNSHLIPGWGISPGEQSGNPLQYSCFL